MTNACMSSLQDGDDLQVNRLVSLAAVPAHMVFWNIKLHFKPCALHVRCCAAVATLCEACRELDSHT